MKVYLKQFLGEKGRFMWPSGSFLALALLMPLGATAQSIVVESLSELQSYLDQNEVDVKLAPGTYTVTAEEVNQGNYSNPLFVFSGNDSSYDFTDVTLNVETQVMQTFGRADVHQIHVVGSRNVLKNLTLADVGSVNDAPTWRATNVVIDGAHNRIEGFHITIKGSFPYGYGDLFGKGGGPVIAHQKHCGVLVRGDFNHLKDSTLIHRAYGHGIYAQGAYDCLIEGCYVEGEVRTTDDILAEAGSGSPADKVNFMTVNGHQVAPGYMISLQEDGIRSYGMANIYGGGKRDTRNMTVKNCTVNKMRSGVVMTHNAGERLVDGCTTINCEKGYSIGRGNIINSRSDAKYGPAYRSDYSSDKNITADITILSNRDAYNGSGLLAYIAGSGDVNITLRGDGIAAANDNLKVLVGGNAETKGHIGTRKSSQDQLKATEVTIENLTDYPLELDALSKDCTVLSQGAVVDDGANNRVLPVGLAEHVETLNIEDYLSKANKEMIYPSPAQIEMLQQFMPADAYQPAPPITDRVFWTMIAQKASAQAIAADALASLDKKPEVPISDEIYRRANKEGNRGIYKPRYYRTMEVLEKAVVAECIENEGRYIPQINAHLTAIMEMKSWLHPNHDDDNNSVLEGKRVAIDLGARKFGSVVMLAAVLLEDRLTDTMQDEIREQIQWRIIDSYLKSCRGEDKKGNSWIWGTSNWNSVCTGGTVFSTLTASEDPVVRLAVLGSAINSMQHYLSGFGDDGYCSEGIGYWNYGFGNYLYLAQTIYDYTDGSIDLFQFNDPEKMQLVGNFPINFEIQDGVYPCFSDGAARVKTGSDNYAYILSAKNYGARKPSYSRPEGITMQLQEWADPVSYVAAESEAVVLPAHTYFEDYGIVISRGEQAVPFSIAIKAGHNEENHNHMDVGSYVMVLADDHIMCGDLGSPPYQAGSFSKTHPVRASWGHPVPRVDGKLQSYGREFRGEVVDAVFSENNDRVVVDIKAAYEVPSLDTLIRTMENDKSGKGTITVTDTFTASDRIEFGTAIMTHGGYEIVDANTVLLMREGRKIKVQISAEGGAFKIHDEEVKVKAIRYADEAFRIGIDFNKKLKSGTITMVFTPED